MTSRRRFPLSDRVIVLTHRPARIRAIHEIDIDVDRTDMMAARESPNFNQYIRSIWSELEVQRQTECRTSPYCGRGSRRPIRCDTWSARPPPSRPGVSGSGGQHARHCLSDRRTGCLACLLGIRHHEFRSPMRSCSGRPSAIWGFLVEMWRDGSLITDTRITAYETSVGFRRRQCPWHR